MKVAFVGCGHGNLDLIYNNLAGSDVDLLIVCGDFEVSICLLLNSVFFVSSFKIFTSPNENNHSLVILSFFTRIIHKYTLHNTVIS